MLTAHSQGPSIGSLPCQRGRLQGDSDQSRPHPVPTTSDITVVRAEADSISHAPGLVWWCRDSPGAQLPSFEGRAQLRWPSSADAHRDGHTETHGGSESLTDRVLSLGSTKPDWPPATSMVRHRQLMTHRFLRLLPLVPSLRLSSRRLSQQLH